jgi:15-cis-phytoene synthase
VTGADAATAFDTHTIVAAARSGEPDRYLAALLAPRAVRGDLLVLAAFAAEIGRVPFAATREPLLGEMRLQWWRDSLVAAATSVRSGHPIADAMGSLVHKRGLPREWLLGLIDAACTEVQPRPFADDEALSGHFASIQGALFRLAGRIIGTARSIDFEAACADGAQAYGMARLLYELPHGLAHGRVALPLSRLRVAGLTPEDVLAGTELGKISAICEHMGGDARAHLVTARRHVANLTRADRVAFLPLALVELYLRATKGSDGALGPHRAAVSPLARIGRIGIAHWRGRP